MDNEENCGFAAADAAPRKPWQAPTMQEISESEVPAHILALFKKALSDKAEGLNTSEDLPQP